MKAEGHEVRRKIPVPSNYRNAAKYLRQAIEEKKCIKKDLLNDKHFRAGRTIMHRLMVNQPQINAIIKHIDLKTKEPRMNEWMARVLICELLYGSGNLVGNCLPVETIRRYANEIRAAFEETKADNPPIEHFKEPRFVRINTSTLNLEGAKRMMQEEGWILVDEEFTNYQAFLDRVRALTDLEYMVDFHFNDMLVFPNSAKGYWARAEHLRSKFFLQNKACLVPTYLLNPAKKSVVLDMCAAPGMKATHLVSLMKNKGRLYAVERDAERYSLLCQYAADFGVIKTIHGDCLNITDEQVPGVQYILVDPSCSGSGMLNRLSVPEPVDEARLFKLAGLQYKLVSHAMKAYPNARRIVYSTCSVHVEENERVVQGVLRHNGHFKLVDARQELGKEWLNVGSSEDFPGIGERCLYARPETDLTIGMFVAVFERCAEDEVNEFYAEHEKQKQSYDRVFTPRNEFRGNHRKDSYRNERSFDVENNEPAVEDTFQAVPNDDEDKQHNRKNEPEPMIKKKKSKRQEVKNEAELPQPVDVENNEPTQEDTVQEVPIDDDDEQHKCKNDPEQVTKKKKSKRQDVTNEAEHPPPVDVENIEPTVEDTVQDVPIDDDDKQRKRKMDPEQVIKKKKSKLQDVKNEAEQPPPVDVETNEPEQVIKKKKSKRQNVKNEAEQPPPVDVENVEPEQVIKKKKSKRQDVKNEAEIPPPVDVENVEPEQVIKKKKSKRQDVKNEAQEDSTEKNGTLEDKGDKKVKRKRQKMNGESQETTAE